MSQNSEAPKMSERDQAMAREIGRVVVERLVEQAQDPETVGMVLDTWGGHVQKMVGRAVLRVVWWVLLTLLVIGSIKFGLLDKLQQALGGKP